jgi:hypothetical protein
MINAVGYGAVRAAGLASLIAAQGALAQSVTPVMRWPVNVRVEGRSVTTVIRQQGGVADTASMTMESLMLVRPHDDGYLITLDAPPSSPPVQQRADGAKVEFVSLEMERNVVISRSGRFLRLDDTAGLSRRMREKFLARYPAPTGLTPQLEAGLRRIVSVERTAKATEMTWQELIGHLLNRSWREGQAIADTTRSPTDTATVLSLSMIVRTTFRGVTDCPIGSNARVCWTFDTHSMPDTAELRQQLRQNAQRMGVDAREADTIRLPFPASFTTVVLDAADARLLMRDASDGFSDPSTIPDRDRTSISRHVTVYTWRPM